MAGWRAAFPDAWMVRPSAWWCNRGRYGPVERGGRYILATVAWIVPAPHSPRFVPGSPCGAPALAGWRSWWRRPSTKGGGRRRLWSGCFPYAPPWPCGCARPANTVGFEIHASSPADRIGLWVPSVMPNRGRVEGGGGDAIRGAWPGTNVESDSSPRPTYPTRAPGPARTVTHTPKGPVWSGRHAALPLRTPKHAKWDRCGRHLPLHHLREGHSACVRSGPAPHGGSRVSLARGPRRMATAPTVAPSCWRCTQNRPTHGPASGSTPLFAVARGADVLDPATITARCRDAAEPRILMRVAVGGRGRRSPGHSQRNRRRKPQRENMWAVHTKLVTTATLPSDATPPPAPLQPRCRGEEGGPWPAGFGVFRAHKPLPPPPDTPPQNTDRPRRDGGGQLIGTDEPRRLASPLDDMRNPGLGPRAQSQSPPPPGNPPPATPNTHARRAPSPASTDGQPSPTSRRSRTHSSHRRHGERPQPRRTHSGGQTAKRPARFPSPDQPQMALADGRGRVLGDSNAVHHRPDRPIRTRPVPAPARVGPPDCGKSSTDRPHGPPRCTPARRGDDRPQKRSRPQTWPPTRRAAPGMIW